MKYDTQKHLPPERIQELFQTKLILEVQVAKFQWGYVITPRSQNKFTIDLCENEQQFYRLVCVKLIQWNDMIDSKWKRMQELIQRDEEKTKKILDVLGVDLTDYSHNDY